MKRIGVLLFILTLFLTSCNTNRVKIRGQIAGFQGNAKLMAEMPGEKGLVILNEQSVTDGKIELYSDVLKLPARVWVDLDGKRTIEFIVDTKDQIWIEGKSQFIDQIEVKGSGLASDYTKVLDILKDKYDNPIKDNMGKMQRLQNKEKPGKMDSQLIDYLIMQRTNYLRSRAKYAKKMIESNLSNEISLFLITDQLKDSLDLQKSLYKMLTIPNKESNIYVTLGEKLNN